MLFPLLAAQSAIQVDLIWSTDCPVAQRWVTRVAAWQASHPSAKVTWYFPVDETKGATAYAKQFNLKGEIRAMKGGDLAFEFALDRFPSTVVRRGNNTVFVGGVGAQADPDSRFLLAEAYSAAVARKPMIPARSEPQGCTIPDPLVEKPNSPVTYLKHVRPTIQRYCLPCHAPGGAAPFRLDRYPDTKRWSHMILDVLERRKMPPVRIYNRTHAAATRPAPSTTEIEQIKVWREFGAPGQDAEPANQTSLPATALSISNLAWPKMGRFRYIDIALPVLSKTSGFTVIGAPQGSVRMAWTFLAPNPPKMTDQGERWKPIPTNWEFVHAAPPQVSVKSTGVYFEAKGRQPVVRLLLYGTGDVRALKFSLAPIPNLNSKAATSVHFPIEKGRIPAFDGAVEQTSLLALLSSKNVHSFTMIGDPSPTVITLLGPSSSWLIGEFTPNSFMPTIQLSPNAKVNQLALNATYGGHSITGERGPSSIAFGDKWNEARLEAFLVVPVQK